MALLASILFFGSIVAGPRLWLFLLMTAPPALGFIYSGVMSRGLRHAR